VNYYEELGLEISAAPEEIRRAYRKLAQVLHPDQQQDETIRGICERQLARLNGIAEILNDPERRREYDLRLQEECRSAGRGRSGRQKAAEFVSGRSLGTWVWVTAAAAGVALMALFFRWNAAPAGEAPYRGGRGGEEAKVQAQLVVPHAAVKAVEAPPRPERAPVASADRSHPHRASARAEASDQAGSATAAPVSSGSKGDPGQGVQVVPEAGQVASVAAAPDAEAAATAHRREQSYFAGRWFFSPEVSQKDRALYRPEMIELAIAEESGVLHGRYRSRYRVTDRPISPDVEFEFTGAAGKAEAMEFTWEGTGGAQGRVRLKAVTPISMEVRWWATRMGALDLTEGTAVLIRGEEP